MWVHMAHNGICVPPPVSHHCAGGAARPRAGDVAPTDFASRGMKKRALGGVGERASRGTLECRSNHCWARRIAPLNWHQRPKKLGSSWRNVPDAQPRASARISHATCLSPQVTRARLSDQLHPVHGVVPCACGRRERLFTLNYTTDSVTRTSADHGRRSWIVQAGGAKWRFWRDPA